MQSRIVVLAVLLAALSSFAWSQQPSSPEDSDEPRPVLDAENRPMWSPQPVRVVSPQELRLESEKLSALVQDLQPKLAQASEGRLDKDLLKELKEVEKLAKKLRNELVY